MSRNLNSLLFFGAPPPQVRVKVQAVKHGDMVQGTIPADETRPMFCHSQERL